MAGWRLFAQSSAFLFEPFREDRSLSIIEMALQPGAFALDGFASLPQGVGLVALVLVAVSFINAGTVNKAAEGVFVYSLVRRKVACAAFEVPLGLLKGMFIRRHWVLLMDLAGWL